MTNSYDVQQAKHCWCKTSMEDEMIMYFNLEMANENFLMHYNFKPDSITTDASRLYSSKKNLHAISTTAITEEEQ
jgi:hypothetical protein